MVFLKHSSKYIYTIPKANDELFSARNPNYSHSSMASRRQNPTLSSPSPSSINPRFLCFLAGSFSFSRRQGRPCAPSIFDRLICLFYASWSSPPPPYEITVHAHITRTTCEVGSNNSIPSTKCFRIPRRGIFRVRIIAGIFVAR